MATHAEIASKSVIEEIVFSNLLKGLDGALERIIVELSGLHDIPMDFLSKDECKEIIAILEKYNLFLLRDSVNTAARILPISRVSIYKYLRK